MIRIDADLREADWLKTIGWDLSTDIDEFIAQSQISTPKDARHFLTLPASEGAPPHIYSWVKRLSEFP